MRYILLIALLFFSQYAVTQICLEGKVTHNGLNKGNEPIQFAHIMLRNVSDTSKIEYATITDLQGKYVFASIAIKPYMIEISCVGYRGLREPIDIVFPEIGHTIELNFQLEVDNNQLNEVIVSANSILQGLDKTSYTILSSDRKNAISAMDLFKKIPSVSIDPLTQKLVSARGKVTIMINGVRANEMDLRTIPPDKVVRIEHYDVPPTRYMSYDALLNVIVRKLDDGMALGGSLQHAFTTGFANDNAFYRFNRGKHQIAANYSLNYRDYHDVSNIEKYDYTFQTHHIQRTEYSTNPFGYNTHNINLKYTNQIQNKYLFQATLSPDMNFKHSDYDLTIDFDDNETLEQRRGTNADHSRVYSPTLDLYYWTQLNNQQTITANAVSTYFSTKQTIDRQEWNADEQSRLEDNMKQDNDRTSLIGELVYDKTIGLNNLSIGNQFSTYWASYMIENSFGHDKYRSTYFSNYLFGEYKGIIRQFQYRLSLGLTYRRNHSPHHTYSSWIVRPLALVGYSPNKKNSFRALFTQTPREAELSQLSNNIIYINDYLLYSGNPSLKNYLIKVFTLNYKFTHKIIESSIDILYSSMKNSISPYFVLSDKAYTLMPLNDSSASVYALIYSGAFRPFGNNKLVLKLNGSLSKTNTRNQLMGNVSFWAFPIQYELASTLGKWDINYKGNVPAYASSGMLKRREESQSVITVKYTHKNISIWGNLFWLFSSPKYYGQTTSLSPVTVSQERYIHDNRRMFTLGFSYTFRSGKEYKTQTKKLENRDSDAGLFNL